MTRPGKWEVSRTLFRVAMMALIMSPLLGYSFFSGNFSSALLFGKLHLTDPLAFLQILLARPWETTFGFVFSAALVLGVYVLLGRVYCGWVCPLGAVLEWIGRLPFFPRQAESNGSGPGRKYELLAVILLASLVGSVPFFLLFSPMAQFERMLAFGLSASVVLLVGVLALDALKGAGYWCHSLCPLGAFYSLVGRWRLLGPRIAPGACNACGRCWQSCPAGAEVIHDAVTREDRSIIQADCTNCGKCIDVCPQDALSFGMRRGEPGLPMSGKAS